MEEIQDEAQPDGQTRSRAALTRLSVPDLVKAIFLLMLAGPLLIKAVIVDNNIYMHTGTRFFGAAHVFSNDAMIYLLIVSLFYLSFLAKTPRLAAITARVLAFLVFAVYAVDGYVIINFNTHLTPGDLLKHAWYTPQYISQVSRKRDILLLASTIPATCLLAWVVFTRYKLRHRSQHVLVGLSLAGMLVASCFTGEQAYIHSWKYKNFITYNLEIRSESHRYSEDFINRPRFRPVEVHESHIAQTPNIIVLMVESLSSYQSQYFSGLKDWTPSLDTIARNNVAYTGFYANGFCTNDCYIATLTGDPPVRPPLAAGLKYGSAFTGFEDPDQSLPRLMAKRGYVTDFLMAADHGFGDVGPWAQLIGFDHIEGHTHPDYDGWERYQFESAPDEALYQRVLKRIAEHGDQQFFMYVSTMSSHHPFVNPESGNNSEQETIRYADKQLGLFHDRLVQMGFFESGILIILGDHHTMVPMKPGEARTFGDYRAAARVPMVVSYGNAKQALHSEPFQQTDIFNSLKNLTGDTLSTSDWAGDIFHGRPAKYIVYRRGDYRDRVSVFTEDNDYLVKLDGDNTRVVKGVTVGEAAGESVKQALVGRINAVRMPPPTKQPAVSLSR